MTVVTEFTCRTCEIADLQTKRTGLAYSCPLHGLAFQTRQAPFRGYVAGCDICEEARESGTLPFVRHDNCVSPTSIGHSRSGHCTADGCY